MYLRLPKRVPLLQYGLPRSLQDWDGKTALMHAASEGHAEIVHLLRDEAPGHRDPLLEAVRPEDS